MNFSTFTWDFSLTKIYINGVLSTITEVAGTNTGEWFDVPTGMDNVSFGALTVDGVSYFGEFDHIYRSYIRK